MADASTQKTQEVYQARATAAFEDAKAHGESVGATAVPRRRTRKGDTAADVDAEMTALNACVSSLHGLDMLARNRVLLYLVRRYDAPIDIVDDAREDGE
jgi:hypothetical protein